MSQCRQASILARIAHKGQRDKAGAPYFEGHILRVVGKTRTYDEATVAYLHDILEDTDLTEADLREFFSTSVAWDVKVLTRCPKEVYADYISRIIRYGSPTAIMVKLADLEDHLDQSDAIAAPLARRYRLAKERLETVSKTRRTGRPSGGANNARHTKGFRYL